MKRLVAVLGACALFGCGGEDEAGAAQTDCTLPDCDAISPLGKVGKPLAAVGSAGFVAWRAGPDHVSGELAYHPLVGAAQQIAEGVLPGSVAVDPLGDTVLYLEPTGTAPTVRGEPIGVLRRWNVHTGTSAQVLEDGRGDAFGVCGDWLWSWHGGGTFANCAWMSAQQISTGRWVDLGDSCDFWAVPELAQFSTDCSSLITGPGAEQAGVQVTHLASGAARNVGAGTGTFLAAPRLDRVAAPAGASGSLLLADLVTGAERPLTDGWSAGQPWRFSASGLSLVYQVQDGEDRNHLLLLRDIGEPIELAENFSFVEAVGFSPNERMVAWVERSIADGRRHLRLHDGEAGAPVLIEADAFAGNDSTIAPVAAAPIHFSPDGRKLLFERWREGGLELALYDVAAGEATRLGSVGDGRRPLVDESGGFVAWIDAAGALRLANLISGTSWQVAEKADDRLFVGDDLVWNAGSEGWRVALPRL